MKRALSRSLQSQRWLTHRSFTSAALARVGGDHAEYHGFESSPSSLLRSAPSGVARPSSRSLHRRRADSLRRGPLQPTPTDTKKAYDPFFAYLAKSSIAISTSSPRRIGRASRSRSPTSRSTSRRWVRGATSSPTTIRSHRRRHREIRRQADLPRDRGMQAGPGREGVAGRRDGQARVFRGRRIHVRMAHSHRVVQDPLDQSEGVLRLFRRHHARRQRNLGGVRPGRLRDRLRPQ